MGESVKCQGCGRRLTAAKSVAAGRGRACRAKVRAAAAVVAETVKPELVAKAVELIADGGLVRVRPTVFQSASSDGTRVYRTAPQGCTCPAGVRGKYLCYHRVAAAIALAA
jgi:hypothetical protein